MKILKKFGRFLGDKEDEYKIKQVAIFGYADSVENDKLFQDVMSVSKRLAEMDFTVVDGGGPGVMRAATLGAKQVGGKVIGVTFYPDDIAYFEGRDPKNLFDKEIKTKSYIERTLTLMEQGQAYVIFNGGTGTISEFGMAWGLARLYFGHHKPLILYGKFWKPIIEAFKKNMLLRPEELKVFKIVDSPDEVVTALEEFEEELKRGQHPDTQATKD